MIYEVCIESIAGAERARAAGAQRVELCANLSQGGTTPSAGLVQTVCAQAIDVVVLLRPRAGDFIYSPTEFEVMRADLTFAKSQRAEGVALGILTTAGEVDEDRCAELVQLAAPMSVCFHRAFDFTRDQEQALEQLVRLGVRRVLTSGGASDVEAGQDALARLVRQAGERIEIMPGGGVRAHNAAAVLRSSAARALHFSASEFLQSSSTHDNPNCSLQAAALPGEAELRVTSEAQIRAIIHASQA